MNHNRNDREDCPNPGATKSFKRQIKELCGQTAEAIEISGWGPGAIEGLTLEGINTFWKT